MTQPLLLLLCTLALCAAVYRLLRRQQILDIPNARSSHSLPTPKGGGIGFVPVICGYAGWQGWISDSIPLLTLALATLALAVMGLVDDLRELSARLRFAVQTALALLLVAVIFGDSHWGLPLALALSALAALFVLWLTNLYNFMDGIDGIACLQGLLCGGLVVGLDLAGLYPGTQADMALAMTMACLGFACFNVPPARMFMGDTGSAALGFLVAGIALLEYRSAPLAFWLWLIALAGFIADASSTLAVRFASGHRVYEAHRSHVYQLYTQYHQQRLLARGLMPEQARTGAHRRTLFAFAAIFALWQCPIAIAVANHGLPGPLGATLALVPMVVLAIYLGAGTDGLRRQGSI